MTPSDVGRAFKVGVDETALEGVMREKKKVILLRTFPTVSNGKTSYCLYIKHSITIFTVQGLGLKG